MESYTSSKSNVSEGSWDFETMCQNTAKLDEMMLSMKQADNVQCNVCNKRKDTLARREEIAWQREEIIHTREKELREWELMLEEKSRLLNGKEKQLKYDEEKCLQIASLHNSEKNSRKSSSSDVGLGTFTLEQRTKDNIKNEFVLEREKLLKEKEKIISENIKNIERKEQSIAIKEQQLNNQRIIFSKERELAAQKNHSFDLREQVVKKLEEAVERKLKGIYEERKSLDERNALLIQKENAFSIAAEYIQNKEQALSERENMIIEKERKIIGQISELGKPAGTQSLGEENKELFKKFDEIFDCKWKSIQERESTIVNSEQILQEKWKEYSEAKELLKSEEESLRDLRDTSEKEKNVLREWGKLLEKRGEEIDQKHELIRASDKYSRILSDESVSWPSLDVQNKMDLRVIKSSPFGAVGQLKDDKLNGDNNSELSGADKNVDLSRETPNSENREISGEELFQFYEKEKETLQVLLLKENADTSTKHGESSNSKGNKELTEPVQSFFERIRASPNLGENKSEQVAGVPEINSTLTQLSLDIHEEISKEVILQEDILNDASVLNSQNKSSVYSENPFILDSSSAFCKRSILLPMIYKESDKKSNVIPSSDLETDTTRNTEEKNGNKQAETCKVDGKDGNTSQNGTESRNPQESGNVLQNTKNSASAEDEKIRVESESCVKNGNDSGKTGSEVSYVRVSPTSSASSSRSLTSPISGRGSPWLGKNKKKPPKDALLQAIAKRNFLETVHLLDTNCMSLEVRNDEGRSAALLAVECGNIELLERLINKGADIKACDYKGYSALHIAVAENNSDMVHFLLKKGLNPRVTDINGNTAVQLASNLKYLTLSEIINNYIATKST